MNGYGPTLPATGGGILGAALVWGVSTQTWLVIAFATIALITLAFCFLKLRLGESKLKRTLKLNILSFPLDWGIKKIITNDRKEGWKRKVREGSVTV